jgi:hypothetical protein
VVPARKRGTPESPDEPAVVAPLLGANYIMLGPGSPTYATGQLAGSLAWHTSLARHRLGAGLVLASASAIAASAYALPVYEIYKVGDELGWKPGLDLLGPFGRSVAVVPHWNNREGGDELDTSRGFLGRQRFERLLTMLPAHVDVLGIDEHTALLIDFSTEMATVFGKGEVTWLHAGHDLRLRAGQPVALESLGLTRRPDPVEAIPRAVWHAACRAHIPGSAGPSPEPPDVVRALVSERTAARVRGDWLAADHLRDRIVTAGWHVRDTPDGPLLVHG